MTLFDLSNKVAIVTGATGLLGQQHCIALAGAGANIVALDLYQDKLDELVSKLPDGLHIGIAGSVIDKEALENIKEIILQRFGRIDVLVNNAAINDKFEDPALASEQSMFEHYPLKMWQASLEANITGTFLPCQVFGAVMAQQNNGSIINIASTYGMVGPDQQLYVDDKGQRTFYKSPSYPATKGAIINFTRYLAAYWGENGVRVNTLSPGGVQNGQEDWFVDNYNRKTPLRRMAQPDDYQGAIVFLASDASAYMTGANLAVDGGWTAI